MLIRLPSRVRCTVLIALALPVMAMPRAAAAQATITPESVSDEHVQKAIAAIVEELYARKHETRFWEPADWPQGISKRQVGGYTALIALALTHAGESYQNPRLSDAIDFMAQYDMVGTYAITMRAALWARLPDKYLPNLEQDVMWLLQGFNERTGCWDYAQDYTLTYWDNSIRQFGALALWEAAKRGGRIPEKVWQRIEAELLQTQLENGAWSYREERPNSGSMTTAGLATLFITQDYLHADEALRIEGRRGAHEKAIERGMTWLDQNFSATENPGTYQYYYYYMYGVERVGLASGYKFFGGHDWFRAGAAEIINRLCLWDPKQRTMTVHKKVGGKGNASAVKEEYLGFGLLFLSRGRVPVALNKLRSPDLAWNNRPRDAANLAGWISRKSEQPVNWQIVDLEQSPEQWLDAPILYLASHEPLAAVEQADIDARSYVREMRDYDKHRASGEIAPDAAPPVALNLPLADKLKRYLDLGGLLLAMNETNARRFAGDIETLGQLMYPQYEWRELPEDHWVFRIHEPVPRRQPPLMGLSNGVRELIILSPTGDLPRTLQGRDEKKDTHFQALSNLYFYASEMDRPRPRLADHAWPAVEGEKTTMSASIVRAMHASNWNAEPLALDLLARKLARRRGMAVTVVEHALAMIDQVQPRPDLVFISGVQRHAFTEAERAAIRSYIDAGGTILFETAGGRGEFTLSAEEMATTLFGAEIQATLHTPIITGQGLEGAADLTRIDFRPYSLIEAFGARETTPRLRCMMIDDRPAVLFSREDISQALLDQPVWGVSGYMPDAAVDLMGNIIQFAK